MAETKKTSKQTKEQELQQLNNEEQQILQQERVEYGGPFGSQGTEDVYSYRGPHQPTGDEDQNDIQDAFGDRVSDQDQGPVYDDQDQFGDVDGQDPYSNLGDEDQRPTPSGEAIDDPEDTLYELSEPLAKEGDVSTAERNTDKYGTRGSQDQYGYQQ